MSSVFLECKVKSLRWQQVKKTKQKKTITESETWRTPTGGRVVLTLTHPFDQCSFWRAKPNVPKMVGLPPSRPTTAGHGSSPWEWSASAPTS